MNQANSYSPLPPIDCHYRGRTIFTGEVIKSRAVDPINNRAKCSWCKQWTPVPVEFKYKSHPNERRTVDVRPCAALEHPNKGSSQ